VSALDGMVKDPLVHGFSRRPWQSTWFATQVTICVQLWRQDTSLTQALQLAIKFLAPCDILDALWPSPCEYLSRNRCSSLMFGVLVTDHLVLSPSKPHERTTSCARTLVQDRWPAVPSTHCVGPSSDAASGFSDRVIFCRPLPTTC
jgi:hypothetical protein